MAQSTSSERVPPAAWWSWRAGVSPTSVLSLKCWGLASPSRASSHPHKLPLCYVIGLGPSVPWLRSLHTRTSKPIWMAVPRRKQVENTHLQPEKAWSNLTKVKQSQGQSEVRSLKFCTSDRGEGRFRAIRLPKTCPGSPRVQFPSPASGKRAGIPYTGGFWLLCGHLASFLHQPSEQFLVLSLGSFFLLHKVSWQRLWKPPFCPQGPFVPLQPGHWSFS